MNFSDSPQRPTASADTLAFGEFTLDPLRRTVWHRDGSELTLTPRLFNALQLFVEHPGELLGKDLLMGALWPGLVVEENSLSQVISALRRALGDDDRRYIQTDPRRGFRFVAEVCLRGPVLPANEASATEAAWPSAVSARNPALAVLPFISLASDGQDDLLEVGMADSLIARLSMLPGLVVRSVGSVRRFAGMDQEPLKAARTLDVVWVVDGSLQRHGDQLRVAARLLSVADGTAVWSGRFDERFTSVFDVQDAIARRVAEALLRQLQDSITTPQPLPAPANGGTRSVDAYQHYLAGLAKSHGIRGSQLRQSAAEFERAIMLDPNYALALVGKADACRRMVWGADSAPVDVFGSTRPWVLQALAIAPQLAEAHCELASILYWYDYNWAEAAREFRQALALKPSLAPAHFGLGYLLVSLGRVDEGLEHTRMACKLDPMGLVFNAHHACFLAHIGERAKAQALLQWILEVAPDFWVGYLAMGRLRLIDGDLDAGITAAHRAHELSGGQSTQAAAMLGAFCARAGRLDEARAMLQKLRRRARERFVPPTSLAAVLAALGDRDAALIELERAFDVHDTRLVYVKDDWRWEPLRNDPRYRTLLHRMKLDGYGPGLAGT